ncbi:hypothetical protein LINPERPRIM_LOCUS25536 [Linum perenne]
MQGSELRIPIATRESDWMLSFLIPNDQAIFIPSTIALISALVIEQLPMLAQKAFTKIPCSFRMRPPITVAPVREKREPSVLRVDHPSSPGRHAFDSHLLLCHGRDWSKRTIGSWGDTIPTM